MSTTYKPYLNQDYEKLKAEHLKSNQLFSDEKFLANDSSLNRSGTKNSGILWKRPGEICPNPQFVVNQIEPNDLDQGQLGNCWLIASAASVLSIPEYMNRVIPSDQTFEKGKYAGIFHFRFWNYGQWVDVVIDDKLPVNQNNQLIYCHNNVDKNEFFGPLLEKAYAKLNSCYEFLIGGNANYGFVDMTGGINEGYALKKPSDDSGKNYLEPTKLWELMFRSYTLKSLSSAAIDVKNGKTQEAVENNGLVVGHAYSIIKIYEILNKNGTFSVLRAGTDQASTDKTIKLLRLRNPWGQINPQKPWNGNWCKGSRDWSQISDGMKVAVGADKQDDGEIMISYDDFLKYYDRLEIVHVDLNAMYNPLVNTSLNLRWTSKQFDGEWIAGKNSGGCGNGDPKSYWINPQYSITLPPTKTNKDLSIVISLMQTESIRMRAEKKPQFEPLCFAIYSIKEGTKPDSNSMYDFKSLQEIGKLPIYLATREVAKRFSVKPGTYVIIPSMFEKNKNMKYLLRVFYESDSGDISSNQHEKVVNDEKNKINPAVLPPITNNNSNVVGKIDNVDLNDAYNKWFYAGLNQAQISTIINDAKIATSKLIK